jgi:hypothetical protein
LSCPAHGSIGGVVGDTIVELVARFQTATTGGSPLQTPGEWATLQRGVLDRQQFADHAAAEAAVTSPWRLW